jgi:hypothetical protein
VPGRAFGPDRLSARHRAALLVGPHHVDPGRRADHCPARDGGAGLHLGAQVQLAATRHGDRGCDVCPLRTRGDARWSWRSGGTGRRGSSCRPDLPRPGDDGRAGTALLCRAGRLVVVPPRTERPVPVPTRPRRALHGRRDQSDQCGPGVLGAARTPGRRAGTAGLHRWAGMVVAGQRCGPDHRGWRAGAAQAPSRARAPALPSRCTR